MYIITTTEEENRYRYGNNKSRKNRQCIYLKPPHTTPAERFRARNFFFNPGLLHVASVRQGGQQKNISSALSPQVAS